MLQQKLLVTNGNLFCFGQTGTHLLRGDAQYDARRKTAIPKGSPRSLRNIFTPFRTLRPSIDTNHFQKTTKHKIFKFSVHTSILIANWGKTKPLLSIRVQFANAIEPYCVGWWTWDVFILPWIEWKSVIQHPRNFQLKIFEINS